MYSTIETVSNKINQTTLIQLLNDEVRPEDEIDLQDSSDPVVVRFNQAASDAQSEIDPYLRGRYTLPFSAVPSLIISISDELTKYYCYKRRGNIPQDIQDEYDRQIKKLEKIQAGKMDLGVANEPQNLSNEIKTNKTSADRIFNKDMWDKY